MNTRMRKRQATVLSAGLLVVTSVLGLFGGVAPSAKADAPAPSSPAETWINPVNVSSSPYYDNTPWIGASPVNGAVTVGWEERDEPNLTWGAIKQNSNTSLGGAFRGVQEIDRVSRGKNNGNVRVAGDQLGRRHIVYWALDGTTCDYYARADADGAVRVNDPIPNACFDPSNGHKNTALAVGTDNIVHALFGKDQVDMLYYQMNTIGSWVVQAERVNPGGGYNPKNITIGVSSLGVVMAAWVGHGPVHSNDVYTAVRLGPNTWSTPENVSANVFPNDSRATTHLPSLARDAAGGMRIVWTQVAVDPFIDPGYDDTFYREWVPGTGWTGQPIVRLSQNRGNSYDATVAVDQLGEAHVMWSDDTNRSTSNFQLIYAKGRGVNFDVFGPVFSQWFGTAYQKESQLDTSPPNQAQGAVHIAFGSNRGDSYKENWYSYAVTGGSPGPTSTPTSTNTPSATPTPCTPGIYTDVHPSDYFYTATVDLGQRGIMNGYGDCTFRPFNNLTRGQTAKIIVLGAQLPINTQGGPHFTDVPTTNPFYDYVETAYNRNIISGYSDGTFRPNNNVTRGQFSKMTVLGFNFAINTTGGPHFTDVPVGSTFYNYVETSFNRGLISGYADGTFRPNANVIRGQAAKIVYLARGQFSTPTPTVTGTPPTETPTATSTPVVVTATPTVTPIVVTATPTLTPLVVTATPTNTATPTLVAR